jgi:hypothetical protein
LSAAVWGDYEIGREHYGQDSRRWLERGWLDFLCPMLYFSDPETFELHLGQHQSDRRGRAMVPAVGAYLLKGSGALLEEQLEAIQRHRPFGYSIYEYGALFEPKEEDSTLLEALRQVQDEQAPSVPRLPWIERRAAGDDDAAGPWFDDLSSDAPFLREGEPFRVGALGIDPSGLSLTGDAARLPRLEAAKRLDFSDAETRDLAPIARAGQPDRAILIPPQAFQAPAAEETILVRAVAWDADNDASDGGAVLDSSRGVSQVLRYRPVKPIQEVRFSGFFGTRLPGPQYPALAPPNQLWASCSDDDAVYAFNRSGRAMPFSPLRAGLNAASESIPLRQPTSIAVDPNNPEEILVASQVEGGGSLFLARFGRMGKLKPGLTLPINGGSFGLDARGQIYVAEATRRRWSVFAPDGTLLGGPLWPLRHGRSAGGFSLFANRHRSGAPMAGASMWFARRGACWMSTTSPTLPTKKRASRCWLVPSSSTTRRPRGKLDH